MEDREIELLQIKADKWDALEKEVVECYINPDTGKEWTDEEAEERGYDLIRIGEISGSAFGMLI